MVHLGSGGMRILRVQGQPQLFSIYETSIGPRRPCFWVPPPRKGKQTHIEEQSCEQGIVIRVMKTVLRASRISRLWKSQGISLPRSFTGVAGPCYLGFRSPWRWGWFLHSLKSFSLLSFVRAPRDPSAGQNRWRVAGWIWSSLILTSVPAIPQCS